MVLRLGMILVTAAMTLGVSSVSFSQNLKEACLERKVEEYQAGRAADGLDMMVKWDLMEEFREECGMPRDLDVNGSLLNDETEALDGRSQSKIPKAFHGFWEEAERCEFLFGVMGVPNIGAVITDTRVDGYENYCEAQEITKSSKNVLDIKLGCEQEGESYNTAITLKLYDNKYLVITTDDTPTQPLVRCD